MFANHFFKHIGNYVTVLGQVKSMEDDKIIIFDGTGNIDISASFMDDDNITVNKIFQYSPSKWTNKTYLPDQVLP